MQGPEVSMAVRRDVCRPDDLTEEQKVRLARGIALAWAAGSKDDAYTNFRHQMASRYSWKPSDVRAFLFGQSQRIRKASDELDGWLGGRGKITFE